MAKTYSKASEEVVDVVAEVRAKWHPVLEQLGVTVDVLFVDEYDDDLDKSTQALKVGGYACAASIAKTSLRHRALGYADALLTIDTYSWQKLGEAQRVALLDHELTHLQVVGDPNGVVWADPEGRLMLAPRFDDLGRPKLKLRLHDYKVEGFREVVVRHREWSIERLQVAASKDPMTGQLAWEWAEPQADAAE